MGNYFESSNITYEAAQNAVSVAIAEGAKIGVLAVVTVVDPSLTMVAFGKADGATPHSVETSRRKANTAASTRKKTGWMSDAFAIQLPLGTGGLLTNIQGGSPLKFEGKHVGGLGVAGGTPDQDASIAAATLAAIGADAD
ncbi:GlcG/HbpS family heme-binding protein [Arthrobacter sp. H14]|uniref:GlcG/HbpS family heme-binding protein n=1 Tax=Arthrobacter sp. H14 TaxID=1312959 RepID=UPI00047DF8FC|nr:heme-binding protein [Arthrobacter sp. H14]